ncbi:LOW QUALITY PROTEIN: zf-RVT domain-containing protein, partial [Cephalotus follicularis]
RREILQLVQFRERSLPVTYLGLPLITKRLSKVDCAPLIEKIMARANSWVSKSLSFVGRLQLIKATLASMQVFWCSMFNLPVSITMECERMLRNFLWGGNGQNHSVGKVKWSKVCKPMKEGGLDIKDMTSWNKALILKQKLNFWSIPSHGLHSWSWHQILLLQNTARAHLLYKCGKGDKFSLWYDPWFHGNSVHALYGHRVICDAGMVGSELLEEVIEGGRWSWPPRARPQRSRDLIEIQQKMQDIPISNASDCIFWQTDGQAFSTKTAWQAIRTQEDEVNWYRLVWHTLRIPKHAFCLWLTIRGAHKTRDKLLALGIVRSAGCVFNCREIEIDHMFFACPYTQKL